jgi:hypothetical protein
MTNLNEGHLHHAELFRERDSDDGVLYLDDVEMCSVSDDCQDAPDDYSARTADKGRVETGG